MRFQELTQRRRRLSNDEARGCELGAMTELDVVLKRSMLGKVSEKRVKTVFKNIFQSFVRVTAGGALVASMALSVAAPAPAGPTRGDIEALAQAKSYLSFKAFSFKGLVGQLDSPYGGQFSVAEATYAAQHCGANWNAQAVRAAKEYLSISSFSLNGLISQLDSAYGDKFTVAQATYGARKAYK